jgi:hypothetical protein
MNFGNRSLAASALLILASGPPALAQTPADGVLTTTTPAKQFVTVAAGPREAASIGSYALRVYGDENPQFPTDHFLAGVVRPRDGSLTKLAWQDVLGDGAKELIVICTSAGSGGYLSADALKISGGKIVPIASVQGVDPKADLIKALKKAATQR